MSSDTLPTTPQEVLATLSLTTLGGLGNILENILGLVVLIGNMYLGAIHAHYNYLFRMTVTTNTLCCYTFIMEVAKLQLPMYKLYLLSHTAYIPMMSVCLSLPYTICLFDKQNCRLRRSASPTPDMPGYCMVGILRTGGSQTPIVAAPMQKWKYL